MAKRKGRKAKIGRRDKSGRLLKPKTRIERAHDGNVIVQARTKLFAVFSPGKPLKPEEHCDGPGQAYVAGLFDGLSVDAKAMRDAAREFGDLYWNWYSDASPKTANIGGAISGRDLSDRRTVAEARFQRMDKALGPLSSPARKAVNLLCVEYYWGDEIAPFLARLINDRRRELGQSVAGFLATQHDRELWKRAIDGLLMIVSGEGTTERVERSAA